MYITYIKTKTTDNQTYIHKFWSTACAKKLFIELLINGAGNVVIYQSFNKYI